MAKTHVEQLADYIRKNLKKGYTLEALKISLVKQGYTRVSIENAVELTNKKLSEEAPIMIEKPQITYKIIKDDKIIEINPIKGFLGWIKSLFG